MKINTQIRNNKTGLIYTVVELAAEFAGIKEGTTNNVSSVVREVSLKDLALLYSVVDTRDAYARNYDR